ncbi:methyltransferase domain-containing protein [Planctomycetaceae bacterium SH139]
MSATYDAATETARQYYNSPDADNFYWEVWGGEDIHVGFYESADEPIRTASRRTVDRMIERLGQVSPATRVLDIGSGYGGAARRMVEQFGCHVTCLNLSEAENQRNRLLNQQAGVSDRIDVVDGRFEDIPMEDQSVDVVWSQDAMLHSGDRRRVLSEVHRVLKPSGRFIFTDPMSADEFPAGVLAPILARIHLPDLGCPKFYQGVASELGWRDHGFACHTEQLVNHYRRVLETMESEGPKLVGKISAEYLQRMQQGLKHWIDGGQAGHLSWGIFLFEKC